MLDLCLVCLQYVEGWRKSIEGTRGSLFEAIRRAASRLMAALVPNYPRLADITAEVVDEVSAGGGSEN